MHEEVAIEVKEKKTRVAAGTSVAACGERERAARAW